MLEEVTGVIVWAYPDGTSCVSCMSEASDALPVKVGTILRFRQARGVVLAERSFNNQLIHRRSVVVESQGVRQVWFAPLCSSDSSKPRSEVKVPPPKKVNKQPVKVPPKK